MKMGVLGYIEKDSKVLMLYRNKKKNDMHEGLWVAPGGHIEKNESPVEALKREIFEETGLKIKDHSLKILLTFPEDGESPFGDVWYGYVYHIKDFSGDIIDCAEGELKWIERSELLSLKMWEGDKIFTGFVFEDGLHEVKLTYKKSVLKDSKVWKI
ncbi:MAG: hypothetical protein C0601_13185 [Candidatus Muiribacterium halophilum]|uniref:Nudix hydrolase domain-containing protein n=1 Tax=Muiribacterium halophilum TaxID=2053465 RepID=A0A2N5Z9I0_MUIH1|nr:MAG: hypothetical protein C0601_13185 [Candidatus Muirbacterium halophilum]